MELFFVLFLMGNFKLLLYKIRQNILEFILGLYHFGSFGMIPVQSYGVEGTLGSAYSATYTAVYVYYRGAAAETTRRFLFNLLFAQR